MNIYQKTIAAACLCLAALSIQAQTQVIAHRGYWKAEGSAQNSLASLRKAAEAKVYGAEFDVQMTADGIVVVNHDNTIGSTSHIPGYLRANQRQQTQKRGDVAYFASLFRGRTQTERPAAYS